MPGEGQKAKLIGNCIHFNRKTGGQGKNDACTRRKNLPEGHTEREPAVSLNKADSHSSLHPDRAQ
jgi:hypothetical protein